MCVYILLMNVRRRVWVAKDSPRTTAGELQRLFESRVRNLKQIFISNIPYITTCCSGGFQGKFTHFTHPKTNSSIFSCQTQLELQMGFYGQMKLKNELFGSKYPMYPIYCWIFNVVGLFFCWKSWTSWSNTWHNGFYQIPTNKRSKPDFLC